jgi:hypothetical protein
MCLPSGSSLQVVKVMHKVRHLSRTEAGSMCERSMLLLPFTKSVNEEHAINALSISVSALYLKYHCPFDDPGN